MNKWQKEAMKYVRKKKEEYWWNCCIHRFKFAKVRNLIYRHGRNYTDIRDFKEYIRKA